MSKDFRGAKIRNKLTRTSNVLTKRTKRLYSVQWTQYSIRPKRSAICNRSSQSLPPESRRQKVSRSLPNCMHGQQTDRKTKLLCHSRLVESTYAILWCSLIMIIVATAAPTKTFYYLSFVSASAHVK